MTTASEIVAELGCGSCATCSQTARRGAGLVHCPAHDDRTPSLNVSEVSGTLLVRCHGGCPQEAVLGALRDRGLWGASNGHAAPVAPRRTVEAIYRYRDETDELLYEVLRFRPKGFTQRRPDPNQPGEWITNVDGVRRVLYGLRQVIDVAAQGWRIYIVEGERDADALNGLDLCATTSPGGAGKWKDEYAQVLLGAAVVVIADKDTPGRRHAQAVARSCFGTTTSLRVLELPGDTVKDASDYLASGGTKAELERLADAAPEWTPSPVIEPLADTTPPELDEAPGTLDVVTIEEFAAVEEPGAAALLGDDASALLPEDGDLMCYGDGGAGKTTLSIDLICHLAAGDDWLGIRVPRPVRGLLIENEGPRPLFRKKIRRKLAGWSGSPIEGRVSVIAGPWGTMTLSDEGRRDELAAIIRDRAIDVVIIGPVVRSGMNEAGTLQQVRDFMALIADVRRRSGRRVAFGLIHHENKGGTVSGAWEGAGDTLLHVQKEGRGRTRVFVQKARWSSAHHGLTLQLAWVEGEGFELIDAPERTDEVIEQELLAAASKNGGAGWNKIAQGIGGKAGRVREIRDRLLADGRLVNAGTDKAMKLWNDEDPAHP